MNWVGHIMIVEPFVCKVDGVCIMNDLQHHQAGNMFQSRSMLMIDIFHRPQECILGFFHWNVRSLNVVTLGALIHGQAGLVVHSASSMLAVTITNHCPSKTMSLSTSDQLANMMCVCHIAIWILI